MSWSVNASGNAPEVATSIKEQIAAGPLADKPAGLNDDGERATVKAVGSLVEQCMGTFDQTRSVAVSASGHMGFADWDRKTGAYQEVNIKIAPSY